MKIPSGAVPMNGDNKTLEAFRGHVPWILIVALLCACLAYIGLLSWKQYARLSCAQQLKKLANEVSSRMDAHLMDTDSSDFCPRVFDATAFRESLLKCPSSSGSYVIELLRDEDHEGSRKSFVAFEPLKNHRDGANVLFEDGHVEFVNRKRYRAILRQWSRRIICEWETSQAEGAQPAETRGRGNGKQ